MTDPEIESKATSVSVIMGTLNEEDRLESCLDALLGQRGVHADQLKILIADGGSVDNTRSILDRYQQAHPQIRWLENPARIAPAGWNICLDHARGDVIILMGAHTVVSDDFVSMSLRALDEHPDAGGVGGRVDTTARGFVANAIALAMSSPFGVGNAAYRFADRPKYVETIAFGAYRRSVFEAVGRFHTDLTRNADWEFNYRVGQAGFRLFLSPEIKSRYSPRSSLMKLWKQQFRTAFEKVKVIRRYPGSLLWRHAIPSLFVLASIGGLWNLTVPAYAMVSLIFSATTAQGNGWRYFPVLPVVFLTIHLSYGLGFIAGWFRHLISRTESAS